MSTSALVGSRVRWTGPTYRDEVSVAYRAAVAGGPLRPPRADERRELCPGDEGLVVELVDQADGKDDLEGSGRGRYVLRFGDVEVQAELPSGLALVLDQHGHPAADTAVSGPSPQVKPGLTASMGAVLRGLSALLRGPRLRRERR